MWNLRRKLRLAHPPFTVPMRTLYEVYQLCSGSTRMSNERVIAAGKLVGTLLWEQLGDGTFFAALTGPDGRYLVECLDNARRFDHQDGRIKIKGIQRHGRPKARYSHSDYQEWLCRPAPQRVFGQ